MLQSCTGPVGEVRLCDRARYIVLIQKDSCLRFLYRCLPRSFLNKFLCHSKPKIDSNASPPQQSRHGKNLAGHCCTISGLLVKQWPMHCSGTLMPHHGERCEDRHWEHFPREVCFVESCFPQAQRPRRRGFGMRSQRRCRRKYLRLAAQFVQQ